MININSLTQQDKGRMVVYIPNGTNMKMEEGIICGWNDIYIFVRYKDDLGSKATHPRDLDWALK